LELDLLESEEKYLFSSGSIIDVPHLSKSITSDTLEGKTIFADIMETIVKKFGVTAIIIIEDENIFIEMSKKYP
jgi:hypothetical protein